MAEADLRSKLAGDMQATDAASLLPHHRRDALFILAPAVDILEVAVAIADDRSDEVARYIESGELWRPSLAQMADWCADLSLRFQFVILQPYVVAQKIVAPRS